MGYRGQCLINSEGEKCVLEKTDQGGRRRRKSRKKDELGEGRQKEDFMNEDT